MKKTVTAYNVYSLLVFGYLFFALLYSVAFIGGNLENSGSDFNRSIAFFYHHPFLLGLLILSIVPWVVISIKKDREEKQAKQQQERMRTRR